MINVCSSAAETADSRTHGVAVTSMTAFIFKFRTSNYLLEEHRVFQKLAWMYPPHPPYPHHHPWPHHDVPMSHSCQSLKSEYKCATPPEGFVLSLFFFYFFTFAGLELKRMEGETSTMTILAYVRKAFYPFVYWIIAMWAGGRTEMMINVQPLRFQLNDMKWHEAALK